MSFLFIRLEPCYLRSKAITATSRVNVAIIAPYNSYVIVITSPQREENRLPFLVTLMRYYNIQTYILSIGYSFYNYFSAAPLHKFAVKIYLVEKIHLWWNKLKKGTYSFGTCTKGGGCYAGRNSYGVNDVASCTGGRSYYNT